MAPLLRHSPPQLLALALVSALVMPLGARADSQGFINHRIAKGDTLEHIAAQFYGNVNLWPQLQSFNQIPDPKRLQPGSTLRVPVKYMPEQTAEVSFVQGKATVVAAGSTAEETPLQPGQKLQEGAAIKVAPDSFVTVKLADGTLIRIQAESDVQLKQLRRKGRSGSLQSVLEMQRGSVNSTVGAEPDPARGFEVRTPKATTSVRGTSFDVILTNEGSALTSVSRGTVAVQPRETASRPEQQGAADAALVRQGHGIAVSSDGRLGEVRALLQSPDLEQIPATLEDANFLSFQLPAVASASAYEVLVARDESMSQVLRSGVFKTSQVRMKGIEDGEYYLAARAIDSQDLPGMPALRKIRVKTQPPPPLYQQPAPGATTSRTSGQLLCTRVSSAQAYRIQVAANADGFATPLIDEVRHGECDMPLAALEPGSYQWRAASIRMLADGTPDQGPFSIPQGFKLANSPTALDISALSSSSDIPGIHLQWPGEPGQTYRIQLSRTEDFSDLVADQPLDKPEWNFTDVRPGEYFVRIETHDTATGLQSPFSAARQVRAAAEVRSNDGLPITSSDGEPLSRR
ncbi:FecR domain-containing protein [Diaphorobacter ruginosibacter]|uniref:FecR domain-containing protein n=1 Tax=Diaphorobacter ruginosibacter TaxID=1715720 RepID=UPI003341163F